MGRRLPRGWTFHVIKQSFDIRDWSQEALFRRRARESLRVLDIHDEDACDRGNPGLGIAKVSKHGWEGRFQNRKRRSADGVGDSKVT